MAITVGGTSITFSDATTQTTAGLTTAVTSAVAGNGITVSGATGAVTISQDIYTGSNLANLSYPVGSYLACVSFNGNQVKNASAAVNNSSGDSYQFYIGGGGSAVSGTWRVRGDCGGSCYPINLVQRTA